MKIKVLLFVSLVAVGYAGFAHAQKPGDSQANRCPSKAGACKVTVTVTVPAQGGSCSVEADLPTVFVKKGNVPITWSLSGPAGYQFAQGGGIVFNKKPGPPPGTFTVRSQAPRQLVLNDKNQGAASGKAWSYTIYVTNGKGDDCQKDPDVDNN